MGSTSDLPVMEKAAKFLDEMEIPFEMNALSAHRTPAEVESFAKGAKERGLQVIIAAAGMAAALPINAAQNAAILATQMIALTDSTIADRLAAYKESLKDKIVKANEELHKVEFKFKCN